MLTDKKFVLDRLSEKLTYKALETIKSNKYFNWIAYTKCPKDIFFKKNKQLPITRQNDNRSNEDY